MFRTLLGSSRAPLTYVGLMLGALAMLGSVLHAAEPMPRVLSPAESLIPFRGSTDGDHPVDTSTLHRKVMCGYQGWFMAQGDGYGMGDVHWGGVNRNPPTCTVDLWPDVSELDRDEKFPTQYKHADGSTAFVFSSTVEKTVLRHFRWMKEYGIDGAFVQRFTAYVTDQQSRNYQRACAVLHHAREGAHRYGRAYAVMYDTDFDRAAVEAIQADWKRLVGEMRLVADGRYLRHRDAPLIALWGYGFDHRKFDAAAAEELFQFFKQPEYGGCTILLGVPNDWTTWRDELLQLLDKYATVISPWTVGRYVDQASLRRFIERHWPADLKYCNAHDKDYYAVAFPGFSWTNLTGGKSPLNQIPRRGGSFFWEQIEQVRAYGLDMVYVAMFDEVDEGTAIFKCTNNPPLGKFCTYEGLASDFYLRLTGDAGRLLRGESVERPAGR